MCSLLGFCLAIYCINMSKKPTLCIIKTWNILQQTTVFYAQNLSCTGQIYPSLPQLYSSLYTVKFFYLIFIHNYCVLRKLDLPYISGLLWGTSSNVNVLLMHVVIQWNNSWNNSRISFKKHQNSPKNQQQLCTTIK